MAETDADRIRRLIGRANAGKEIAALYQHPAVQSVRTSLIGSTVDAILKTNDATERERLVLLHRAFLAFFDAIEGTIKSGARAAHELDQEKS